MIKTSSYLCTTLLFCFYGSVGQVSPKRFDADVFSKLCINDTWTLEDSTKKKKEELFLLNFTKDKKLLWMYINWIEGGYSANCKYDLSFKDNVAEIIPKAWKNEDGSNRDMKGTVPMYIYCCYENKESLFVLFKDTKQSISDELLKDKDWMKLEKIKK